MPASTITKPEPDTGTIEAASVWLRSALVVRSTNRRSSSARIARREIVDVLHGAAADAFTDDLGGVALALCSSQFDFVVGIPRSAGR